LYKHIYAIGFHSTHGCKLITDFVYRFWIYSKWSNYIWYCVQFSSHFR